MYDTMPNLVSIILTLTVDADGLTLLSLSHPAPPNPDWVLK